MTAANDVASWEILKAKVLSSRLHSPAAWLVRFWDGLKHPTPVYSCYLFILFVSIYLVFSRARNLKEDHIRTRAALHALITVVAPTYSLWPSRYIELARALRSRIEIPFEVIFNDTTNGAIEFRDLSNDLGDLIGSGTVVNGQTICINIGWRWWVRCFKWWILAERHCPSPVLMSGLSDWLHWSIPTANSGPLNLPSSPLALTSSILHPLHCLDRLPYGAIPTLNAGCKSILEFTAFSPSLRTFSTAQVISVIPFIFSERPRRRPRTLVSVLKQLSVSYGPNIAIDSLSNVSVDYEHALRHAHRSFSREQKIRETWVKILGIKGWRREMFLVALEAALVRRGWIERWAVQVTIK